eukprot:393161_1
MKKLKKKMINPHLLTLQYGSYLGVNLFGHLKKGNTKLPHMTHTRAAKMWYSRAGKSMLSSLCDIPMTVVGNYDNFGPMSKDELSKWIPIMYLEYDDHDYGKLMLLKLSANITKKLIGCS